MENATDALKIAFAAIVFIIALAIAITMFSLLNDTSKIVLASSDITQYYEYEIETQSTRIVGLETIIPTLYRYYKENYTVLFLKNNGEPLGLYESQMSEDIWGAGNEDTVSEEKRNIGKYYNNKSNNNPVCTFDVNEEVYRNEPWTGSINDYKKNLDAFLNGEKFDYPNEEEDESGNTKNYNYDNEFATGGFIKEYAGKKFKEMLGEYIYNLNTDENTYNALSNNKKKRIIIYQLQ